jgi:hypothetical protein
MKTRISQNWYQSIAYDLTLSAGIFFFIFVGHGPLNLKNRLNRLNTLYCDLIR